MSYSRCRSATLAVLLGALSVPVLPAAAAPRVLSYSVVSNGEVVGSLEARAERGVERVNYHVSNNGRGPTIEETVRLEHGIPVEYSAEGTTAFGGVVHERMTWDRTILRWESAADHGEMPTSAATLYVPNDGTPWSYGVIARALLAQPRHSLPAAPSGLIALNDLGPRRVAGVETHGYSLTGISLTPEILLLDRDGQLFAVLSSLGEIVLPKGRESAYHELLSAGKEIARAQAAREQRVLAHHYDTPIRIRNVHVFDPRTGTTGAVQSVVLFRGRIASVAPESAAPLDWHDEVAIDGQGGTVIPGLHNMHAHDTVGSGLFYLAAGVTSVRDVGNDNADLLDLSAAIDAGTLPGPRIWRAGLLEGRSEYSARIGRIANTLPEAIDSVRWYAEHGYRMIKIYNSLPADWVKPVAAEAHRLGLRVNGHVPAFMSPDRAIEDGYDEITHLNQLSLGWVLKPGEDTRTPIRLTALGERARTIDVSGPAVRSTLELMKRHGTALDPTIAIIERLLLSRAGTVAAGDAPYLDHTPIGYQRYRKRSFVNFTSPEHDRAYRESFQRLVEVLAAVHREGIRVLPGTDDTTGFTLHRELELYVAAGMTAPEVLTLATLGCEQYLGRDQELGTIEAGKRADLVLLEADPAANISAVRRARMVIKDDAVYFPDEIYPVLGIRPFAARPPLTTAAP